MTDKCPECGCEDYINKNLVGEGFRLCSKCGQEWWVDVDYTTKVPTALKLPFRKDVPAKLQPLWDYFKMRCNAKKGCNEVCQECPYTRVWRVW